MKKTIGIILLVIVGLNIISIIVRISNYDSIGSPIYLIILGMMLTGGIILLKHKNNMKNKSTQTLTKFQSEPESEPESKSEPKKNDLDIILEQINSLNEIRKKSLLSEKEFLDKLSILKERKANIIKKQNEEKQRIEQQKLDSLINKRLEPLIKQLETLFKGGVLTKEEFEKKKNKLFNEEMDKPVKNEFNKYGFLNRKGEIIIDFQYDRAFDFSEGLALVFNKGDQQDFYGFIDENGNIVIPLKYEYAESFSEGLALVRLNRKFGFINKKDEIAIDIIYDDANSFVNYKAKVKIGNRKFYIDKNGRDNFDPSIK